MKIGKRSLPTYILLNCLTLGVYGFITALKIDRDVNSLCKGDRQHPSVRYFVAWLISKLPIVGVVYYLYWWYQQANRLKLNANRYGIRVKESGTDIFLMRTVMELPMTLISVLYLACALLVPALIIWWFWLLTPTLGSVWFYLLIAVLWLFGNELSAGAVFSVCYMIKNLNRYADVCGNGAKLFDPMAYEYYPCAAVQYPAKIGNAAMTSLAVDVVEEEQPQKPPLRFGGVLVGEKGTCAGYKFDLNPGEEIIIGKDAKVASVVIDPAYKEISRKHVGVTYDIVRDQYCVVDYSSNGTWANGSKLTAGQAVYLPHGTELELANPKNRFLLG